MGLNTNKIIRIIRIRPIESQHLRIRTKSNRPGSSLIARPNCRSHASKSLRHRAILHPRHELEEDLRRGVQTGAAPAVLDAGSEEEAVESVDIDVAGAGHLGKDTVVVIHAAVGRDQLVSHAVPDQHLGAALLEQGEVWVGEVYGLIILRDGRVEDLVEVVTGEIKGGRRRGLYLLDKGLNPTLADGKEGEVAAVGGRAVRGQEAASIRPDQARILAQT